jgi:hypothetical protein
MLILTWSSSAPALAQRRDLKAVARQRDQITAFATVIGERYM